MVRLQCDEQLANGGSSKQMLNPWQAEPWKSRGAMELFIPSKRCLSDLLQPAGLGKCKPSGSLTEAPFLVGPPRILSVALCPPCLAWQLVVHLCLQLCCASSYRCSSGRASGWQGLRGASCSTLYNTLSIAPNSKNLAMHLTCGGAFGCQDTDMRSQCYARTGFEGKGKP